MNQSNFQMTSSNINADGTTCQMNKIQLFNSSSTTGLMTAADDANSNGGVNPPLTTSVDKSTPSSYQPASANISIISKSKSQNKSPPKHKSRRVVTDNSKSSIGHVQQQIQQQFQHQQESQHYPQTTKHHCRGSAGTNSESNNCSIISSNGLPHNHAAVNFGGGVGLKQKIVSVAKYLSPTRSHVSQHVKPLFANRGDRNAKIQQVCSTQHPNTVIPAASSTAIGPKTASHTKTAVTYQYHSTTISGGLHQNHRGSKTHLRRPDAMPSDFHSFSDDTTDSYDMVMSGGHASRALDEAETPTMRLQQNGIKPYKAVQAKMQKLCLNSDDGDQQKNASTFDMNDLSGTKKQPLSVCSNGSDPQALQTASIAKEREQKYQYQFESILQEMPIMKKSSQHKLSKDILLSSTNSMMATMQAQSSDPFQQTIQPKRMRSSRVHKAANAAAENNALLMATAPSQIFSLHSQAKANGQHQHHNLFNMHKVSKSDISQLSASCGVTNSIKSGVNSTVCLKHSQQEALESGVKHYKHRKGSQQNTRSRIIEKHAGRYKNNSSSNFSGSSAEHLSGHLVSANSTVMPSHWGFQQQLLKQRPAKKKCRRPLENSLNQDGVIFTKSGGEQVPKSTNASNLLSKKSTISEKATPKLSIISQETAKYQQKVAAGMKNSSITLLTPASTKHNSNNNQNLNTGKIQKTTGIHQQRKLPFKSRGGSRHCITSPVRNNYLKAAQVAKPTVLACPPDQVMNSILVQKELKRGDHHVRSSSGQQKTLASQRSANLKKRRSEQELTTHTSYANNSNIATPISSQKLNHAGGKASLAKIIKQSSDTHFGLTSSNGTSGAGPVRCQLNKGIRNLLKSKSQSSHHTKKSLMINKRQPLGEVNSNVSSTILTSSQEPHNDEHKVRGDGRELAHEDTHINILAHANNYFCDNNSQSNNNFTNDNNHIHDLYNGPLQGDDDSAPMPEVPTRTGSETYGGFVPSLNSDFSKLQPYCNKPLNQKLQQKIANDEAPSYSDLTPANMLTAKNNEQCNGPVFSNLITSTMSNGDYGDSARMAFVGGIRQVKTNLDMLPCRMNSNSGAVLQSKMSDIKSNFNISSAQGANDEVDDTTPSLDFHPRQNTTELAEVQDDQTMPEDATHINRQIKFHTLKESNTGNSASIEEFNASSTKIFNSNKYHNQILPSWSKSYYNNDETGHDMEMYGNVNYIDHQKVHLPNDQSCQSSQSNLTILMNGKNDIRIPDQSKLLFKESYKEDKQKLYASVPESIPNQYEETSTNIMTQVAHYVPEKLPVSQKQSSSMVSQHSVTVSGSVRRKRGQRAASSKQDICSSNNKQRAPSVTANSQCSATPVVTLNLNVPRSTSKTPQDNQQQITSPCNLPHVVYTQQPTTEVRSVGDRSKTTSFNAQNRRISSSKKSSEKAIPVAVVSISSPAPAPLMPFIVDHSISFAAAAESCQGGMTQFIMDQEGSQHKEDRTSEQSGEQQASATCTVQENNYHKKELLIEGKNVLENEGDAAAIGAANEIMYNLDKNDYQTVDVQQQEDRQVGQQYSDQIKLNFNKYKSAAMMSKLDAKTVKAENAIKGANFDDILGRRDLEVTTKSSPQMEIEDTEEQEHQIDGQTYPRQSMPMSFGAPKHLNLIVRPIEEQPYSTEKQFQTVNVDEARQRQPVKQQARKSNFLKKYKSTQRSEKVAAQGGANQTGSRMPSSFTGKKMSRNSACLSPSSLYNSNKNINNTKQLLTAQRRLTTIANARGRNAAVGNQDTMMSSGGQPTLSLAYRTNAQVRQVLKESRSVGGATMTKSHSQFNGNTSNNTTSINVGQHLNRGTQNQKLFAVDGMAASSKNNCSLTPRKQQLDMSHRMSNISQNKKIIRKQQSTDRCSNNADTISQGTRLAKSPGQKSQGALSVHQPSMYVLKSTKKLTQFKEFAITPSSKEIANGVAPQNAFISPLKLKQLERKHGVSLLGGNTPSTNANNAAAAAQGLSNGGASNAPHFSLAAQLVTKSPLELAVNGAMCADTGAMINGQISQGADEAQMDGEGSSTQQQQQMAPQERSKKQVHVISDKDQELLKNNDAMDAYMRELCEKYF